MCLMRYPVGVEKIPRVVHGAITTHREAPLTTERKIDANSLRSRVPVDHSLRLRFFGIVTWMSK